MAVRKQIDPIAQFLQEHDTALVQLSSLNKAARGVAERGFSPDIHRRFVRALAFLEDEVSIHNKSEERALFPVLERYVEGPTILMREDHKILKRDFRRLRNSYRKAAADEADAAASQELRSVALEVVQTFVNHIHKENHILFPLVQKFLTKDALREVARRMLQTGKT